MKDIISDLLDLLDKAFEDVSKDWEERVEPFIEKAKQSIKHPHFYYAEVDTKKLTMEYKRKKWYQWLSGKRVVHIKLLPIECDGLPSYSTMNDYCLYEWNIKKENRIIMTEKEYRDYIYEKANKVKTKKDLDKLLKQVIKSKDLDYGKIVYAISACMIATAKYIDRSDVGGITGFQASFIGWEMVKEFMHESKIGMRLVDYEHMLYPQYEEEFEKTISKDIWEALRNEAYENMKNNPEGVHPEVFNHWKSIFQGEVPFGFVVKDNKDE